MKTLLLTLLMTTNAFAIITKNCPETLELNLKGAQVTRSEAIFHGEYRNFDRFIKLRDLVSEEKNFSGTVEITSRYNSECRYSGKDNQGRYLEVRLEGSTRTGAVKPAQAVVYFAEEAVTYLRLKKVAPKGLNVSRLNAPLYFTSLQCSYGECVSDYTDVGSIEFAALK